MKRGNLQIVVVTFLLLSARAAVGFVGIVAQDDFEDDAAATNADTLSGRPIGPFGPGDATGAGFFPSNPLAVAAKLSRASKTLPKARLTSLTARSR